MSSSSEHSAAHYFLEGLVELGIEYLFCNFGTDHASLIEELARWDAAGRAHPNVILCPHENVAIHMAGAYAALTGRGQAVIVHVDAGTANAAMGMHNLFRGRLPVLLVAGKAPHTIHGELPGSRDNYVHFVQDPFDIGSLVRPYVKWEYSLPTGVVVKEALRRADSVMHSDPCGPVYLTLPREVLAAQHRDDTVQAYGADRYGAVARGGVTPDCAAQIADALLAAEHPIVITGYLGRRADAVGALDALARECGIAVYEYSPSFLSMPRSSPCFAGYDTGAAIRTADLGLLLDVDVPWLPKYSRDNPAMRWIQIDVDALKKDFPMWGFPAHLRLEADCATVLAQVLDSVKSRATPVFRACVAQRKVALEAQHSQRRAAADKAAAEPGEPDAVAAAHVCAALNRALRVDDIVFNEAIRNAPAVLAQLVRDAPLTLMTAAGGGLGWSGGMALGAKLACPHQRVVQIVGDGGFHFSTPASVYAVAQQYRLPILTVVLDNGGWQAVKEATLRVYPDGVAAQTGNFQSQLKGEKRDFALVGQAFGAYGETLSDPAQTDDAIARCVAAVDAGRAAVLVVKLKNQ